MNFFEKSIDMTHQHILQPVDVSVVQQLPDALFQLKKDNFVKTLITWAKVV